MTDIVHVDTQFLRSALNVFENLDAFEQAARSSDSRRRAGNVATLVDALDLCNLLILGERIVFDSEVGGGRDQKVLDQVDRVARLLGDAAIGDMFRASFGGVAPANEQASLSIQLKAAENATAFFPRLARCARNVLDLFHLPHDPPSEPRENLLRYVEVRRQPSPAVIEAIASRKEITGRRFYAAMLSDEIAFRALCEARQRMELTEDMLAVLFMNFRLRLAEQRSISQEKVLIAGAGGQRSLADALVYLPSMGRRDFTREFSQFVRWGSDPRARNGHAFDHGLREYVVEDWEGIGCQVQLSERRAIPIVVASVLASKGLKDSHKPETLLAECLRWKKENQKQVKAIREATHEFESLNEDKRKAKAATYVAEILKSPSSNSALNRAIGGRLAARDQWLGMGIRMVMDPVGTLKKFAIDSTDKVVKHFQVTRSPEYMTATRLSEAARPILLGVSPEVRQRLIDIFGGTVLDARNPNFDPDRFPAAA